VPGLNFRSWRDTGITWLAIAGVDATKMLRRAGHDTISTTLGYVKMAEDLTGTIGEPFPPLPPALVEGAPPSDGPRGGPTPAVRAKVQAKCVFRPIVNARIGPS
jgi:hypothetical protein